MTKICRYGFGTRVPLGFDLTVNKVEEMLTLRGFTITNRLRMDDVLNVELSEFFGRYLIFGACNPQFARPLFNADPNIGLMMPSNLIIYELQEGGCKVMINDPARVMDLIDSPLAIEASMKINEQLEEIIEELGNL